MSPACPKCRNSPANAQHVIRNNYVCRDCGHAFKTTGFTPTGGGILGTTASFIVIDDPQTPGELEHLLKRLPHTHIVHHYQPEIILTDRQRDDIARLIEAASPPALRAHQAEVLARIPFPATSAGVTKTSDTIMHYRNGRPAKNGDKIVQLNSDSGEIIARGQLQNATPGNDFCNGELVITGYGPQGPAIVIGACMCDCLHVDDVAHVLAQKGLDKRPGQKPTAEDVAWAREQPVNDPIESAQRESLTDIAPPASAGSSKPDDPTQ